MIPIVASGPALTVRWPQALFGAALITLQWLSTTPSVPTSCVPARCY